MKKSVNTVNSVILLRGKCRILKFAFMWPIIEPADNEASNQKEGNKG